MALKNLVVNCENCYQMGQIGVAIGRAEKVEGLKVINFKNHYVASTHSMLLIFMKISP